MLEGVATGKRWFLFALFVACHIYFFHIYRHFISPNEMSRLLLTSALVDDRSLSIDRAIERYGNTQDKATFNGRYYSDKAIGTSLLALPGFLLLRGFEGVTGIHLSTQWALFWVRVFTVTIPAILFLQVLLRFWNRIRPNSKFLSLFLFLHLFGTIAFTYSSLFVSHYLLGCALYISAFYLNETRRQGAKPFRSAWISGIFAGVSLLLEFPAVFPVAILCICAVAVFRNLQKIVSFSIPVGLSILLILGYNYAIFGTPWDVTYNHMTHSFHTTKHAQGFLGIGLPNPQALYGLLLSRHHGLFFLSPFLLLAIPGFVRMYRSGDDSFTAKLFIPIALAITLLYSGFSYWIAGWNFGPRYLAPILPFLSTAAFYFIDEFAKDRFRRILFHAAAIWSVLCVTAGTITFPFPPDNLKDTVFFLHLPLLLNNATGENIGGNPWFFFVLLLFTLLLLLAFVQKDHPGATAKKNVRLPVAAIAVAAIMIAIGIYTKPAPSPMEHYAKGSVYLYLGRYPEAFREMQFALAANPDARTRVMIQQRMKDLSRLVKQ